MSDKPRLIREVRSDVYCHAIFSVNVNGEPRLTVYAEREDLTGRPYWEEEIDSATEAGVFEWALLNPTP